MDGEKLKKFSLSMILIAMILLTFAMAFTPPVKADGTVVSVEPATVDIAAVGQTQTVDINITNVTNMYAYEIRIWYLNSIVNTTTANVVRPTGHFMEPKLDPGNYYAGPKWLANQTYNGTSGLIWVSYVLLAPEVGQDGSGILLRITFTGVQVGSTPVILANYPGSSGPVKLAAFTTLPITHTVSNGTINVIPEFIMLLPVLAITSLVAVSLAKFRKKKQLQ
jgi:hypothetical protein